MPEMAGSSAPVEAPIGDYSARWATLHKTWLPKAREGSKSRLERNFRGVAATVTLARRTR